MAMGPQCLGLLQGNLFGNSAAIGSNPTTSTTPTEGTCPANTILQGAFCVPLSSSSSTTPITTVNSQPIANAGASQSVARGSLVTLNGVGSTAGSTITTPPGTINQGTITTYNWVQTSGTAVTLTGPTTVTPTFTAPSNSTTLTFSLTVIDSLGLTSSAATTTVTVS
jgi:hypothetical protein